MCGERAGFKERQWLYRERERKREKRKLIYEKLIGPSIQPRTDNAGWECTRARSYPGFAALVVFMHYCILCNGSRDKCRQMCQSQREWLDLVSTVAARY
ncbi:hypothetical protein BJY04DRAFT_202889 [Aspergillus karnatakaensis]|uniref:uncharacterized protein n=1 Tax=Aspergillus karnatakaensis TaxID=1810916 RepID=UPI003CCD71AA